MRKPTELEKRARTIRASARWTDALFDEIANETRDTLALADCFGAHTLVQAAVGDDRYDALASRHDHRFLTYELGIDQARRANSSRGERQ